MNLIIWLKSSNFTISYKDNLIFGTVFSDIITGSAEQDYIDGLGGADIINGGSGTDYLIMFESSNNIQISEIDGVYRLSSKEC